MVLMARFHAMSLSFFRSLSILPLMQRDIVASSDPCFSLSIRALLFYFPAIERACKSG